MSGSRTRARAGALLTIGLAAIVVVGLVLGSGGSQDRVREITERLRCPVCQAESVAASPSATAREMTRVVRTQVRDGRSDDEILAFFRARYGDWILLDPPKAGSSLLLWLLPPAALVVGAAVVLRRRRLTAPRPATPATSEAAGNRRARASEWRARLTLPWTGPGRRVVGIAVTAGALVAAVALVVHATAPGQASSASTTAGTRDLAAVTTAELAQVVDENPGVVPMRLALVERYLRDGAVADAFIQATNALERATTDDDHRRALQLAGWTSALTGRPREGAAMLEQSLALGPTDRDTIWYLANVRLVGLGDPAGAITLLQELQDGSLDDERARAVDARLEEARTALIAQSAS